jgi:hypothetical protein
MMTAFKRHIPAEQVDRAVLNQMAEMMKGSEDLLSEQTAKMLGQEDPFSKAMIEQQLKNIDKQFDAIMQTGLPEEMRAYLGMMGFQAWSSTTTAKSCGWNSPARRGTKVSKEKSTVFNYELGTSLNLLHHPKMGQAQYLQRRFFQKLQNSTQEFSKHAKARNDIVVRAEDDRAFDEFDGQAVK